LASARSSGYAAPKTSASQEIEADISGVSGSVGKTSERGFRLNSTAGSPFVGTKLLSSSGFEIFSGLWGGGAAFRSAGETTLVTLGDPDHPATLTIPPGALSSDFVVFAATSPLTRPLYAAPATILEANENLARSFTAYTQPLDGCLWEFLVLDADGNRHTAPLQAPATLSLPYRDANNDGLVDDTHPPLRTQNLSIWWLDETHRLWVKLSPATLDTAHRRVSAPIRHFSVFTVMGTPSFHVGDAFAFPVPWRPEGPQAGAGANQTGTLSDGITFSNLPSEAKIRIHTLSGEIVREIDHNDGLPQKKWDAKNSDGEDAVSGTYIYVIDAGGQKKFGKIVIIR